MKYLTDKIVFYPLIISLTVINIVLIISSSFGIDDYNQILSFEDDEAKLTGWIYTNIINKNVEHLNDFNYGYLYETINVIFGIFLEKLNIEQTYSQIAFTGRILSIIFLNLSLFAFYKLLIIFKINKILSIFFLLVVLFNVDLIYWGHKVHPDLLQFLLLIITLIFLFKVRVIENYFLVTFFCSLAFSVKYGGLFYIPFIYLHFLIFSYISKIGLKKIIKYTYLNIFLFLIIFYITNPYQLILFKKSIAFFYNNFKFTSSGKFDFNITLEWLRIYSENFGYVSFSLIIIGVISFVLKNLMNSKQILNSILNRSCNLEQVNIFILLIWVLINIFHIFFKVPVVEMRYSFHIIPILVLCSAIGYNYYFDKFYNFKLIKIFLIVVLFLFSIIRPQILFSNLTYIKSDKGFFYADYAMPLLGMNKYKTDLYKGYIFIKNNINKEKFILYEKGLYLDESYENQRLINFISNENITKYDPDYFIFTKLMTGRFCWLHDIVICREEVRADLRENARSTLVHFTNSKKIIFKNNDVIIFKNN
tara:strand:+ start:24734 stop:26335 length:1602 start_codon:yes stop_codon:yes gene_type:complete